MPWLKWTDGQTHDVTILSTDAASRLVHWTAQGSRDCAGAACLVCQQLGQPKQRWATEVRVGEEQFTWEMSNQVYTNLCAISHKLQAFAGLQISITRNGLSLQTTYLLIPTGTGNVEELPPPVTTHVADKPFGAAVKDEGKRVANAIAETIKHLCKGADLDPKKAYAAWIAGEGAPQKDATADIQLEQFLNYLEQSVAPAEEEEAEPVTAESLL